jgi:5-oxoprolinase (ATP-hydrolysing)
VADPVQLELFTNRLAAIAAEMGAMLRRTALSTNVKERLDFSCAVLDPAGALVVNAPHIPVHLGSLGLCVRAVQGAIALEPGDTVATNHPAFGGSHLPDVTVVTPVFAESQAGSLLAIVANRAHHAEIGGVRPGSVPPDASCLAEEGVVLPPMHLIEGGRPRWEAVRDALLAGPFPSRAVEENLADLSAAVAANQVGAAALRGLAAEHGAETLLHWMGELRHEAGRRMEEAIGELEDGRREAVEELDDGTPLRVSITIRGSRAVFDFTGSGPVHPGNLNATPAIVTSVVMYVLRLLVERPLPLNEGLLDPVEIVMPPGILNPDFPGDGGQAPAVVGGNVETSQRLVDTVLKALGLAACSQGTMNNVVFGNPRYGYYETIAGGCGAGPGYAGACGVHSHMTNTRATDPELLEQRYPVRLVRFTRRPGSGGKGLFDGGDGLVRELEFLEGADLSLLTQHRKVAPYGMAGGGAGRPGRQLLIRAGGDSSELPSVAGCRVGPGDRLLIETPGGGGWGAVEEPPQGSEQAP